MKFVVKHIILLVVGLFISAWGFAQVEFVAKTSHTTLKTGDRFQLQFSANASMDKFKAPDLSNFRVLSGPNPSKQVYMVNGKTSYSIQYSYILMAIKEGEFTIQPATAIIDGKKMSTNTLDISVGKGVNVQQDNSSNTTKPKDAPDDVFIKTSVSKTKAYMGENILTTIKLYYRVNVVGLEHSKTSDMNGFWSQPIESGNEQEFEVIGGYRWQVHTIKKAVVFPQRSGKLVIDPYEVVCTVQRRVSGGGQSLFDQFYQRVKNVEYELKTKPITINVLPHPEPKPSSFVGAVGKMDMKVDVSSNEVKANEAVNIKVKISGKGNINLVEAPQIEFPVDFETYDPKVIENTKASEAGVSGSREFDFLVIPRHMGQFEIPPIAFSYFNTATKKYETISSDPISINVLKGDESSENMIYSSNKEEVKVIGNDIRYIKTSPIQLNSAKSAFYNTWKFYVSLGLAPLLFMLAYVFRNSIRAAQRDVIGMKRKKASKVAAKFLASAKKSLDAGNSNEFYENVSKALFGYISDKLNIPQSELNQENVKSKLTEHKVSEQSCQALASTLELCDMARFAPITISDHELYDKAANSINQIEQEVKT